MTNKKTEEVESSSKYSFEVAEPQIIKPKDLPLVVTPAKGKEWANDEQAEFAQTLNGYAYKNPEKWATKKDDVVVDGKTIPGLLSQLAELEKNPSLINKIRGGKQDNKRVEFKNHLIEN